MKLATLSYIGGYLIQKLKLQVNCVDCLNQLQEPKSSSLLHRLILNQDRGGLLYPNNKFVHIVNTIQEFVDEVGNVFRNCNVAETICNVLMLKLEKCPIFTCPANPIHFPRFWELVCKELVPILLKNLAQTISDERERRKYFNSKMLNRKVHKLP